MDLSNENIIHIKKEKIEYLQFKKLLKYSDKITHAYCIGLDKNFRTTKESKQKNPEVYNNAIKNYKDLCNELDFTYNNIIKANQNHTDKIQTVNCKTNIDEPDLFVYENTDGLITNKPNLVLSTTNADCILILFYDPVKNVVSNVHSGWKGTLQEISVKAIEKMKEEYECNPKDIIACMCPSIRKCHFEVDKDVKDLFWDKFKNLYNIKEIISENYEKQKWNIDTVLINKTILLNAGLLEENIVDSKICSVCNKEVIHSLRAEGENYGLSTALISLK